MIDIDPNTLQDVAAIVGPLAAAVAAGVSLFSVRLNRRIARQTVLPDLSIQPIINPETGLLGAMVHNAGTGVARGAYFVIARGDNRSVDAVGHGVVRPNELYEIQTQIPGRLPVAPQGPLGSVNFNGGMIIGCRDREGNFHVWTHQEKHRQWRQARKPATLTDRFRAMFPDIDIDILTPTPARIHGPK